MGKRVRSEARTRRTATRALRRQDRKRAEAMERARETIRAREADPHQEAAERVVRGRDPRVVVIVGKDATVADLDGLERRLRAEVKLG